FPLVLQKLRRLAMRIAGIRTCADLDCVALQACDVVEGLFEGKIAEDCAEDADFHGMKWVGVFAKVQCCIKKERAFRQAYTVSPCANALEQVLRMFSNRAGQPCSTTSKKSFSAKTRS